MSFSHALIGSAGAFLLVFAGGLLMRVNPRAGKGFVRGWFAVCAAVWLLVFGLTQWPPTNTVGALLFFLFAGATVFGSLRSVQLAIGRARVRRRFARDERVGVS